jgi:inner membrane protein
LDNLTHSLFALTLARTPLGRAGRGTTAALLLASNAPDIDIVTTAGGALNYLKWHRGPTHGLLGIIGLGVAATGIVWTGRSILDRRRSAAEATAAANIAPDASFGILVAVSLMCVIFHVLMDLPTSYGIRPLSPFDWHWFAVDWMPIVDIYLLMVLVAGAIDFGRPSPAARRRKAAIVLTLMAANYGLRGYAHHRALDIVPRVFGPTLARWCDPDESRDRTIESWPREKKDKTPSPPPEGKRCLVDVAALPALGSPFQWRIIAQYSNAYEIRDIDLLDGRFREPDVDGEAPWRLTLRYPNVWTPAVMQAARTRLAEVFLGFSRYPAARSAIDAHGVTTVRWTDVRFAGAVVPGERALARSNLFTALVRIDANGQVIQETLGR